MGLAKAVVVVSTLVGSILFMQSIANAKGIIPTYAFKNKSLEALCLQAVVVASLPAIVLVFLTMMLRLISRGADPLRAQEPDLLKVTKLSLTNTMEQSFIFVVNLLAASTFE